MKSGTISISIAIPFDQWEKEGPKEDPSERLLTTLTINGCPMHVEAVAVSDDGLPGAKFQNLIKAPDWIAQALENSADYEPVQTVEINGREYALIATPYQR